MFLLSPPSFEATVHSVSTNHLTKGEEQLQYEEYAYSIEGLRSTGWAAGCGLEVVNYNLILTEHFSPGQIMEFNLHQADAIYTTTNLTCRTLMSLASTYTDSAENELENISNAEWDPSLGNTYILDPKQTLITGG